jgi:two-component system, chemotaxis family, chemotaxis protein CheY
MKILIIDDEIAAQTRLVALLKPFGECDTASDGPEAILKIQQSFLDFDFYDLMAIDINIPSISGLDLLIKINHDEMLLGMPVSKKLVVSSEGTPGNVKAAADRKCDGFIVKPVAKEILYKHLARLGLYTKKN